ncbi:hypothetical protein G6F59_017369 [Rhizopus arrhizus]|nr:hypothetical protein G6F59_017369 [Rhizopus arrhizus]
MASRLPRAQPITGASSIGSSSATSARMVSASFSRDIASPNSALAAWSRRCSKTAASRMSSRPSARTAFIAASTRSPRRRSCDSMAAYSRPVLAPTGSCLRACLTFSARAISSRRRTPSGWASCACCRSAKMRSATLSPSSSNAG